MKKYILLQLRFASLSNSKQILMKDAKNYKLATAQTCNFLNASNIKIMLSITNACSHEVYVIYTFYAT